MSDANSFRPSLLIGIGGTGSRIAQSVFSRAKRNGLVNSGRVKVLSFDTDDNDTRRLGELSSDQKVRYSTAQCVDDLLDNYPEVEQNWFVQPRSELPMEIRRMTLLDGAGQVRMLSRLALHDAAGRGEIERVVGAALRGLAEHNNKGGFEGIVNVTLVGSLAGATGSGAFLQIAALAQYIAKQSNIAVNIYGLFLLPDVYARSGEMPAGQIPNVLANGYASLKEFHAVTLKAAEREGRMDFDFEYAPGLKLGAGDIPFDSLTLIDYEDMKGANLGRSIETYRLLTEKAAYMLLFTPVGGKRDSTTVNDIRDTVGAAADGTHNRVAGLGLSAIEYPYESIKRYLTNQIGLASIAGDWLRLDNQYYNRVQRFKQLRASGNMTAKEPERASAYLRDLKQLSDEQLPFFREIYDSLYPILVDPKRGSETVPRHNTFLDHFGDHVERTFWSATVLDDARERAQLDIDRFDAREAIIEEVRKSEGRLDRDLAAIEAELINRPNDIVINLFSTADDFSEGELRDYHLQKYLIKDGPHLVQSRAFLYALQLELKTRLSSLSPKEDRKRLFATANILDPERGNDPDERGSSKIIHTAREVSERGIVKRLFKGGKDEFVETYVSYFNGSISQLRTYARNGLRAKAYSVLLEEVEEMIRVQHGLFSEIEKSKERLQEAVKKEEERHNIGVHARDNNLYVCADSTCKKALWHEVEKGMAGQRLETQSNSRLTENLVQIARTNRVEMKHGDLRELRDIFETVVVNEFAAARINTEFSSVYDMSVVAAVRKEAEIKEIDAEEELRRITTLAVQQSRALLTTKRESDGQMIQYWALSPDTRQEISQITDPDKLLNPLAQDGTQSVEAEEFSSREMVSVTLLVNLQMEYLAKLSPKRESSNSVSSDRAGRYYSAYSEMVTELVDAAREERVARTLTPHIHRDWHKPGILPEISTAETHRHIAGLSKSFAIAMAFDLLQLKERHGERVSEIRTTGRVIKGGVSISLGESHELYDNLLAFELHPEAVQASHHFWVEKRLSIKNGTEKQNFETVANAEILGRILSIAGQRTNAIRRDQRVSELVEGYAILLSEFVEVTRRELPAEIRFRDVDAKLRDLLPLAVEWLEKAGVLAENIEICQDRFARGMEQWRSRQDENQAH
ncbi:MAG: hypothetical protein JKY82_06645 [Rhizobiaceae bacterium]|nr:hypothetical protein [Rhizobiaceae bacterium]